MKSRTQSALMFLTALILSTSPSFSLTDETYVGMWKFDLNGQYSLLSQFDKAVLDTKLVEKKDCYRFDHGDMKGALVYFCKRTKTINDTFNQIFTATTTPDTTTAYEVPLEMTTSSLTLAATTLDCSSYRCNTDRNTCSAQYVGGNLVCRHRTHACTQP